jgi:hypothetical protein
MEKIYINADSEITNANGDCMSICGVCQVVFKDDFNDGNPVCNDCQDKDYIPF